jgi:hypothetical protein
LLDLLLARSRSLKRGFLAYFNERLHDRRYFKAGISPP